jgi:preprotein translocase subunit SecF
MENANVNIGEIRQSFLKMNLGDVTVKKFGKKNDFLVKIEISKTDDKNFIKRLTKNYLLIWVLKRILEELRMLVLKLVMNYFKRVF